MSETVVVPERFRRAIVLHIAKNLVHLPIARVPLILGIHGTSGDGKTFQCEHVLSEMGVRAFLISGGQLESSNAGDPARLVRETYLTAGRSVTAGEANAAAVVINDVDTGLGSWGSLVQTTINTQTVYGELMHICDYPNSVEGRVTKRVPIILTGNDFTKLYGPLMRAGRMSSFAWLPTFEEKCQVVGRIFPELAEDDIPLMVAEFGTQPVSFFGHLRSSLLDNILWEECKRVGTAGVVPLLLSIRPEIRFTAPLGQLIDIGNELLSSHQLVNHLGPTSHDSNLNPQLN